MRTVLLALIGFFPTEGKGAIGALDWPPKTCRRLAKESLKWKCRVCNKRNDELLPPLPAGRPNASDGSDPLSQIKKDKQLALLVDDTINANIVAPRPSENAPPPPPPSTDEEEGSSVRSPPVVDTAEINETKDARSEDNLVPTDGKLPASSPPATIPEADSTQTATSSTGETTDTTTALRHRGPDENRPQPNHGMDGTNTTASNVATTHGFLERNMDAINRIINVLIILVGLILALVAARKWGYLA